VVTPSPDGGIISQPVTIVCANSNGGTLIVSGISGVSSGGNLHRMAVRAGHKSPTQTIH
jgi:hypothetical protein